MSAARAVIFDLDGVLVETHAFHFEAWKRWGEEVGLAHRITEEWFRSTFGRRNDTIIPTIWPTPLTPEEVERLSERKEALFREVARGRIRPLPGARELVQALHRAGFRLAVGTSTPPENLEMILESIQLTPYFPVRVTSADVQRGKPDPEVFLRAAEQLRVPPERCVVIEDAHVGVEAARRGGMRCIAVTTTHPAERLREADWVVTSLTEVTPERVAALLEGATEKQ